MISFLKREGHQSRILTPPIGSRPLGGAQGTGSAPGAVTAKDLGTPPQLASWGWCPGKCPAGSVGEGRPSSGSCCGSRDRSQGGRNAQELLPRGWTFSKGFLKLSECFFCSLTAVFQSPWSRHGAQPLLQVM